MLLKQTVQTSNSAIWENSRLALMKNTIYLTMLI